MARYVVANRRSGKFQEKEKLAAREALGTVFERVTENACVIHDYAPIDTGARRVVIFEAEPAEVAAKTRDLPADVLVEPEILHSCSPMDFSGIGRTFPPAPAPGPARREWQTDALLVSGPVDGVCRSGARIPSRTSGFACRRTACSGRIVGTEAL